MKKLSLTLLALAPITTLSAQTQTTSKPPASSTTKPTTIRPRPSATTGIVTNHPLLSAWESYLTAQYNKIVADQVYTENLDNLLSGILMDKANINETKQFQQDFQNFKSQLAKKQ